MKRLWKKLLVPSSYEICSVEGGSDPRLWKGKRIHLGWLLMLAAWKEMGSWC